MTAEQFAFWLNGYVELTAGQQPTPEQWKSITEHLKTVFVKVTPEVQIKPSINWPLGTAPTDIAKMIRDAARDGVRDQLPFGPFPGTVRDRLDLHGVTITC